MSVRARLDQYACLLADEFDEITQSTISINNTGIFYANEFSENLETTLVSANTFSPFNIITFSFAEEDFGVGQGVYMRQTSTGTCIIYNEIDEVTTLV